MHNDMVVKPAECCEVSWVGWSALGPWHNMVGLETVSAGASVCCATTVPVQDGSAEFG
jgi:hypothetical protein